jgi:hypothetical protein
MVIRATSIQAPSSIPLRRTSLLHPIGSVTQKWQPTLGESLNGKCDPLADTSPSKIKLQEGARELVGDACGHG